MRPIKVALCDDSAKEREFFYNMCKFIREYKGIEILLKEYETGDSMLFDFEDSRLRHSVDIILLDINMPGKNGIEVAEDLREMGYCGLIIFITVSHNHWKGAFDVKALNYITKGDEDVEKRFLSVFMEAYRQVMSKRDETLLFSALGEKRKIGIRSISHFEVSDHLVRVYYDDTYFEFISSLTKIKEQLFGNNDFHQINRNTIISISHIMKVESGNVIMLNGEVIPVATRRMKGLKEAIVAHGNVINMQYKATHDKKEQAIREQVESLSRKRKVDEFTEI